MQQTYLHIASDTQTCRSRTYDPEIWQEMQRLSMPQLADLAPGGGAGFSIVKWRRVAAWDMGFKLQLCS